MTLLERLGQPADAKLLIVSCDDLGLSHAANEGVFHSLREGWANSAGLMVPAPWAREAASRYRGEDVGVHLTLNADYDKFRWSPITQAPSLLGGDGGFPRTVTDLWDHADLDECRRECQAQIERAIYWGFDVSHLDSHLGVLEMRPEFFDILLDLAVEFDLPIRLPDEAAQAIAGFPFRDLAASENVLFPDRVVSLGLASSPEVVEQVLETLEPGLTEICLRPAASTPELRAFADDWETQVAHLEILRNKHHFEQLITNAGVKQVGYASLRKAQRAAKTGSGA